MIDSTGNYNQLAMSKTSQNADQVKSSIKLSFSVQKLYSAVLERLNRVYLCCVA